jgi:hypothetical protein
MPIVYPELQFKMLPMEKFAFIASDNSYCIIFDKGWMRGSDNSFARSRSLEEDKTISKIWMANVDRFIFGISQGSAGGIMVFNGVLDSALTLNNAYDFYYKKQTFLIGGITSNDGSTVVVEAIYRIPTIGNDFTDIYRKMEGASNDIKTRTSACSELLPIDP